MMEEFPSIVKQLQVGKSTELPPLFLFHDAGGTIFSYYSLGDLDRSVYAIANPHFETGEPWNGGIMEMAQTYYAAIKEIQPAGEILLGGWSLGGTIAVQVAWIFARDLKVQVRGIVMIDCPFPTKGAAGSKLVMPPAPPGMSGSLQFNLETSVRHAVDMLSAWRVPRWSPRLGKPPPAFMLFASEYLPASASEEVAMVDRLRTDKTLGWGSCGIDLVKDSIDVPGNHFNVFDSDYIDALTLSLRTACSVLTN